jgi:hypothetical protein
MPSTLDILAAFGEDALQNHYMVIIPSFPNVLALANLNMRVKAFDLPAQTIGTYEITKRGKKLTRPSGVSDQGNEFTFTYRSDKYFQVYNSISQWMSFIQNPTNMAMASDSGPLGAGGASEFRVPFIVNGLDTNNIITNVWSFSGCWPSSQDAISFDEDNGDPIEVSVTMQYITAVYPGTTL